MLLNAEARGRVMRERLAAANVFGEHDRRLVLHLAHECPTSDLPASLLGKTQILNPRQSPYPDSPIKTDPEQRVCVPNVCRCSCFRRQYGRIRLFIRACEWIPLTRGGEIHKKMTARSDLAEVTPATLPIHSEPAGALETITRVAFGPREALMLLKSPISPVMAL